MVYAQDFAEMLRSLMAESGIGVRELGRRVYRDKAYISRVASGKQRPSPEAARDIDDVLGASGELAALARRPIPGLRTCGRCPLPSAQSPCLPCWPARKSWRKGTTWTAARSPQQQWDCSQGWPCPLSRTRRPCRLPRSAGCARPPTICGHRTGRWAGRQCCGRPSASTPRRAPCSTTAPTRPPWGANWRLCRLTWRRAPGSWRSTRVSSRWPAACSASRRCWPGALVTRC